MNDKASLAPLSFDRSKLKSLIRHLDIRLDVERSDCAPWVGDAALAQVVHHGTSVLIPGGPESALFLLARTFVAIEMLAGVIGVVTDDEATLAGGEETSTAQLVMRFVAEISAVGLAQSRSDAARHLSNARLTLARFSAEQFDVDLASHIREIAKRLPRDN